MNLEERKQPVSTAKLLAILSVFFVLGIAMVIEPVVFSINMYTEFQNKAVDISFEKGTIYMFGGGLSLLAFSIGSFIAKLTKSRMSELNQKIVATMMIAGVILALMLPQIADYYVEATMSKAGYSECKSKTYQWLFVKTIVYSTKQPCD